MTTEHTVLENGMPMDQPLSCILWNAALAPSPYFCSGNHISENMFERLALLLCVRGNPWVQFLVWRQAIQTKVVVELKFRLVYLWTHFKNWVYSCPRLKGWGDIVPIHMDPTVRAAVSHQDSCVSLLCLFSSVSNMRWLTMPRK